MSEYRTPPKKLVDLNPKWFTDWQGVGVEPRSGTGVEFDCPCGRGANCVGRSCCDRVREPARRWPDAAVGHDEVATNRRHVRDAHPFAVNPRCWALARVAAQRRAGELLMPVDRARHGQLVTGVGIGDCFRACMSVLLGVPNGDHLPNDHEPGRWWQTWQDLLGSVGLAMGHGGPKGAIWRTPPWIASVPSKNYNCTHSIVMHEGGRVLFDPSPLQRYEEESLLNAEVLGGTWLEVADGNKLAAFAGWRAAIVGAR